jgi:hypothetical protein
VPRKTLHPTMALTPLYANCMAAFRT